ncbi:MAG: ABC transporter substrate-binding protein [Chloroflexota bacterium]|nr:ABC transporter substrate-binding protein [Chloroflexota bacterium]
MTHSERESVTRGFLFADLRGYTGFVESHGAAAAASLLTRYRALAREAIGRFGGAEIKTEGDSFYVVFGSVSGAVRCGLALVAEAAAASDAHPEEPIRIGVGIHAGETVELDDGYVGSAVNIAARLCAQAGPGEVMVSETVRALTRTLLPVTFKSRGRRELKGISEPIELFAVVPAGPGIDAWAESGRRGHWRRGRRAMLGAGALAVIAMVGAGAWALRGPSGLPPGEWTIGIDLPLSGVFAESGVPLRNAVQLAIDEANDAGVLEGVELVLRAYDDAAAGGEQLPDPERGATNAAAMADDPRTIAMVGPYNSDVAMEQIPVTNEAGLLQCSPSTTDPGLTKPDFGALELRAAQPDRINFVRLSPSDDNQLRGLAAYATQDLGAESVLVVNDDPRFTLWAEAFGASFTDVGGRVAEASHQPGADPMVALDALRRGSGLDAVFYAGFNAASAAELRRGMVDNGLGATPFLTADSLLGGTGADPDSYLNLAGEAAVGSYASHSSIGPYRASFIDAYRARFGEEPDEYAAAAHACAEVIIQSLSAVAASGASAEDLRGAVRLHAVDPAHRFDTVLGTVGFDANGDSIQQFVTLFRVAPQAAEGAGEWVVIKQQDYGVASE